MPKSTLDAAAARPAFVGGMAGRITRRVLAYTTLTALVMGGLGLYGTYRMIWNRVVESQPLALRLSSEWVRERLEQAPAELERLAQGAALQAWAEDVPKTTDGSDPDPSGRLEVLSEADAVSKTADDVGPDPSVTSCARRAPSTPSWWTPCKASSCVPSWGVSRSPRFGRSVSIPDRLCTWFRCRFATHSVGPWPPVTAWFDAASWQRACGRSLWAEGEISSSSIPNVGYSRRRDRSEPTKTSRCLRIS